METEAEDASQMLDHILRILFTVVNTEFQRWTLYPKCPDATIMRGAEI